MSKSKNKTTTPNNLESKVKNLETSLARAMADYQNLEKRFERDSSQVVKFATSSLLSKLIEYRDHLERAANHLDDNTLSLLLSEFDKLLAKEQVEMIDTKQGFDPALMECADLVPGEKDLIVSVERPGYTLHGRVLRPARVNLGSGTPAKPNK